VNLATYLLIFFLTFTHFSTRAEGDALDLLALSLDELVKLKVKTASFTEESITTAPGAITVFSRAEIERLAVDYLHELTVLVPGYQSAREFDYGYQYSISARARKTGSSAREILFLIDGIPANNPRNGNAAGLFMYPTKHIERIEVLRGPGAALYGSNAITGVVNIISRKGDSSLSFAFGALNRSKVDLLYSVDYQGWQVDISAFAEQDHGQAYSIPDTFTSNRIQTSDPLSQGMFQVNISSERTKLNALYRTIDSDDFYNTGRVSNEHNFSQQNNLKLSISHQIEGIEGIASSVTASLVYVNSKNGNQSTPVGAFSAVSEPQSEAPLFGYGEFKSRRMLLDWRNSMELSKDSSIIFGLEWRQDAIIEALGYTNFDLVDITTQDYPITFYDGLSPGTPIADEVSLTSKSAYGQYKRVFADAWTATIGLRYDHYDNFPARVSPRLILIKELSENQLVKLLYGEAYRVPNFAEVGFKNTVGVTSNPNLIHEVVRTWDAIWLKQWRFVHVQLGVFSNQYDNPIIDAIVNGNRTFINGDNEDSFGAELELQWQPSENWFYRFTASRVIDAPESAFREALNLFSLYVNYQTEQFNFNISASHTGERKSLRQGGGFNSVPHYWLLNSKFSYGLADKLVLDLQVKNLLNKQYQTPGLDGSVPEGVPNRGREWSISISYSF